MQTHGYYDKVTIPVQPYMLQLGQAGSGNQYDLEICTWDVQ